MSLIKEVYKILFNLSLSEEDSISKIPSLTYDNNYLNFNYDTDEDADSLPSEFDDNNNLSFEFDDTELYETNKNKKETNM